MELVLLPLFWTCEFAWCILCQVLSRTPQLSDEIYQSLLEYAQSEGYDVSKLHKTEQLEGVGEASAESDENVDRAGLWWLKSLFGK